MRTSHVTWRVVPKSVCVALGTKSNGISKHMLADCSWQFPVLACADCLCRKDRRCRHQSVVVVIATMIVLATVRRNRGYSRRQ